MLLTEIKNSCSSSTDAYHTVQEVPDNSEREFSKLPVDLRLERYDQNFLHCSGVGH